jgi:putative CocE/NonD family hydrolase
MMLFQRLLAMLTSAALLAAFHGYAASAAHETYPEVIRQQDVMVAARDGVLLATDIYRPASGTVPAPERLPVLLHRTPYDKSEPAAIAIAENLAKHGYVVLVQDTRGRHHSQGVFEKYYAFDAYDGYDTIEWAASQAFSDGKVGMYGTSYAAHTQADASKLAPPHMRALLLNMGGMANAWDHSVRYDGAFEMGRQLTWAWSQASDDAKDPVTKSMLSKEDVTAWYSALPIRKGLSPLAIAPNYEHYYLDEATHADYGAHWDTLGMQWEKYYAQTADVPMMHVGGWYDIYLRGTIQNWRSLAAVKKSPMRLVIGPWTHHGNTASYAGDVEFGADAAIKDFDTDFHLRWFDRYLKDVQTPNSTQAPVRYFLMGTGDGHKDPAGRLYHGGEWRESREWPPVESRAAIFYLHADGSLNAHAAAASEPPSTHFQFDPTHPVPTIGGGVSKRLKDGAYDQRERADMPGSRPPYLPLRARSDVLVFQSEVLARDLVLAGPVEVTLYASSSGVDTDFTAKLIDVYPPSADFPTGFDMNLTDGIVRASFRDRSKQRRLLSPGKIYSIVIRPFDTANVVKKGHRLRVDISSSNFPRFDVNPNTGEPLGMNRFNKTVENTIYYDAGQASTIKLYVLP